MNTVKRVVVQIVNAVNMNVTLPIMRWAGSEILTAPTKNEPQNYVESDSSINASVLMAAFQDHIDMMRDDPTNCQAMLNGCMEAYRSSEQISRAALMMFASLIGNGYPPDEAMIRVQANSLMLGILLERRLSK